MRCLKHLLLAIVLATISAPALAQVGPGPVPGVALSAANTWTGAQTFQAAITYGGVTLSNTVTGTGSMVLSSGPTVANLVGTGTMTTPILRGGANASATLVLESTSASGTTDALTFKTGNVVTAINIDTNQLITVPRISSDAGLTDASMCEDTTVHGIHSGSGTLGICLGTSSARYKRGIAALTLGLTEIMRMKPVRFFYRPGRGYDVRKPYYGVLAEDLVHVAPELVGLDKDGKPNTADMLGMVPIIIRAMQQQQVEITFLQRHLARRATKG